VRDPRLRCDLPEVLLIAIAVALGTMLATLRSFSPALDPEHPYGTRYGTKMSQGPEEWLIRDFFQDRRGGFFVDVGANHYRDNSNTYFLEATLGWSGLAIDPQARFADGYRQHRPRTTFLPVFVSDRPGEIDFHVPLHNPGVASADRTYVAGVDQIARTDRVPTLTLNQILKQARVGQIDLLSMDIERWEPKALAGFDIRRFQPALVVIEGHAPIRQKIIAYMHEHSYVVAGKYWTVDLKNLYFIPRGADEPPLDSSADRHE